jgi:hypothetical protein
MKNKAALFFYNMAQQIYRKILPKSLRRFLWRSKMHLRNIAAGKTRTKKALKFEIHLAEHCNLNCASCNHFSPLAGEEYLDVDSYRNDCARIAELTNGHIEMIRLMGGEPLLHPQLIEIMKISRQFFDNGTLIEIVTNGILLPKQPAEFWAQCKENAVRIFISKYPIKLNLDLIETVSKQYCVPIIYSNNIDKSNNWRSEPLDLSGSQNIKTNFFVCYKGNNCIQLKNGKLFTCQQAAYINHFNNHFNTRLEITKKDYISIYGDVSITEILRFLAKPIPFCRYCLIGDNYKPRNNQQWRISEQDITEWT